MIKKIPKIPPMEKSVRIFNHIFIIFGMNDDECYSIDDKEVTMNNLNNNPNLDNDDINSSTPLSYGNFITELAQTKNTGYSIDDS